MNFISERRWIMPRYFILFRPKTSKDIITQTNVEYVSEHDARLAFTKAHPETVIVDIRKGVKFTTSEISIKKLSLKYAQ
mgnify:CR=1 FL=1